MPSLFRYFSLKNANAFLDEGLVLLRTLSYFRDYEDEGVRSDEYEGTLVHRPSNGLKVTYVHTGEEVQIPYTFESAANEDQIFVYCLSTELSSQIATRFRAEACVEILRPEIFLARLRSSLRLRKRFDEAELVHEAVRYYEFHEPPIVDWALPERIALRKPKLFEWQKEYRIAVPQKNAFNVENVKVTLVPLGKARERRQLTHPEERVKLGNLRKICRLHRF